MSGRLAGKVALITGASRGIGAAVAEAYAREGAELVLVARTVGGLEETDDRVQKAGSKATLVPMDLTDFDQIDRLGAILFEKFGHLDIFVGNAATLGVMGPLAHADPKMWKQVMDLNLTANWRLLRSLDPLLMRAETGRVLMVTSGAAQAAFAYWGAYAASKAALEMLVRTYAAEHTKTAVKANLVDPGIVATKMRAAAYPGEDPSALPKPEHIAPFFIELVLPEMIQNGHRFQAEG